MSYFLERSIRGEAIEITTSETHHFKEGNVIPLTFDVAPKVNGTWKVIEVVPGISVKLEREVLKIKSYWLKNITSVEYDKSKRSKDR